ncbi:ABC transporter ATP-binding protein [Oenococcus sp. UCMA 17063]|nr:ABC transporter ATP-binding protein [Oenococcus sp. UCMA 17063]
MALLELSGVNKRFGDKLVLQGLDMSVPEGSIYGFVGENGAGKTTTMKMILGLETLDSGVIKIGGVPVKYGQSASQHSIGYLPDVPEYYDYMTSTEYLTLCGKLARIPNIDLSERIHSMLQTVDLPENSRRIHGFSRGMKQRLGIAQALLAHPRLLICDEPTSALDPSGRNDFLNLLESLKQTTTIVFSTHILADVERVCDHVGILNNGSLQTQGRLSELKLQYAKPRIILKFRSKQLANQASEIVGQGSSTTDTKISVPYTGDGEAAMKNVLTLVLDAGLIPLAVERQETSLEDIFMEVVQ